MTSADLEQRLARLEALEAIRTLKAVYCLHCDRDYQADEIAALFTADAVWDGGARGRFEGREAIRAFFKQASAHFSFAAHLVMNPVIEVDGDEATGLWRMLMPCTIQDGGAATTAIQVAEYDERYRREQGRWLIRSLRVRRRRLDLKEGSWALQ